MLAAHDAHGPGLQVANEAQLPQEPPPEAARQGAGGTGEPEGLLGGMRRAGVEDGPTLLQQGARPLPAAQRGGRSGGWKELAEAWASRGLPSPAPTETQIRSRWQRHVSPKAEKKKAEKDEVEAAMVWPTTYMPTLMTSVPPTLVVRIM